AMSTIPTSQLLCISTGYAQIGVLFDMHKKYHGKDDDEILVWQSDTRTMNPIVSDSLIERELERDPEGASAEWLGVVCADISACFPLEAIEVCVGSGRSELLPSVDVVPYFGFVDTSGGMSDSFTVAVAHVQQDGERVVIDAIRASKPPFGPPVVTKEFSEFL